MSKVISWDQYFMGIAKLSAYRSKDPNTQVGACIVSPENKIVGVGYHGLPWGCEDTEFPWNSREGDMYDTKYPYVVHAELNAILNSIQNLKGCRIYVSLFPCHECVKAIIQSGIQKIIYEDDKYNDTPSDRAAKRMLDAAGVAYQKMQRFDIEIKDYQHIIQKMQAEILDWRNRKDEQYAGMMDYYTMWVHQIKTPIAALRVIFQSAGEENAELPYAKTMKMELFKIEQYVEMVLSYLRMEEMSSDLAFEEYQLDDIVRQAVRKYSQMFILKRIRLDFQPLQHAVLTDEKWLVFVVEQILSNALKYTKEGSISIYLTTYREKLMLAIRDTGIGISREDLPRVFEKGFTGYNGRADKKSTGIGLYLCKKIMDKLRHGIYIESEVDQGTTVYLYLEREK